MDTLIESLELISLNPNASLEELEAGFRLAREAEALGLVAIRYELDNPPPLWKIEQYAENGEKLFNRFRQMKSKANN